MKQSIANIANQGLAQVYVFCPDRGLLSKSRVQELDPSSNFRNGTVASKCYAKQRLKLELDSTNVANMLALMYVLQFEGHFDALNTCSDEYGTLTRNMVCCTDTLTAKVDKWGTQETRCHQKISKFHKLPHCHVWICGSLCMSLFDCRNQHCAVCNLSASQSKHATFTVALA